MTAPPIEDLERALRDEDLWRGVDRARPAKRRLRPAEETDESSTFRLYLRNRERETVEARELVPELLKVASARSWFAAASNRRFHTGGVVRELLDAGDAVFFQRPTLALELVRLAIYIAGFLQPGAETTLLLGDAHKELSNALWNVNRYTDALAAADDAECFYAKVAGTEEKLAILDVVRSVIFERMNERLDHARSLLRHAAGVFLTHGNSRKYVDARLAEGMVLFGQRDYPGALEVWSDLLKGADDVGPRVSAQLHNNLGHCWRNLGNRERAGQCFYQALQMYVELDMRSEIARVSFGLAQMEFEDGHSLEALRLFRAAQRGFVAVQKPLGACEVSLKMIELLVQIGDWDGALEESSKLPEAFTAAAMSTRAREAAAYVVDIVRRRRATVRQVQHVGAFVKELGLDPSSDRPFLPPAPHG